VGEEEVGVERGVEPEEADVAAGIHGARARGDLQPEAGAVCIGTEMAMTLRARACRVHRLHRDVHQGRAATGALQEGRRPGHRERLMPQLMQATRRMSPALAWRSVYTSGRPQIEAALDAGRARSRCRQNTATAAGGDHEQRCEQQGHPGVAREVAEEPAAVWDTAMPR
jgi:hypothetical protein